MNGLVLFGFLAGFEVREFDLVCFIINASYEDYGKQG
jgi:hypothetical protein